MFTKVLIILYDIIPYATLIVCNILLIYTVYMAKRNTTAGNSADTKRQNRMTWTIIIITLLFIGCTLPTTCIQFGPTLNILFSSSVGLLIMITFNVFTYTFQASNFFMLYFTNNRFKQEVKNIFGITNKKTNQKATTTTTVT